MNEKMFISLARNNIKKNKGVFFPFALSASSMIALYYVISSVSASVVESDGFYGYETVRGVLYLGSWICCIFAAGVIFYTNGFLLKQRSKELGLYSILGMEKRHIAKALFWEMVFLGSGCIAAGLFFGIVFSKIMFLLLLKMMHLNVNIPFMISGKVIVQTILIFTAVFGLNMIKNILKTRFIRPINLFMDSRKGEREPNAKWLRAVLSLAFLFAGYYIAVTTKNPVKAISNFFFAVLFVMAGTYFLFMSGSVALLKLLKKNKKYYYHKTHFIAVSGMIYRMKRNAAGLANICILSTAVLVVFSSTVSLYAGIKDYIKASSIREVTTTYYCPTQQQHQKEFPEGDVPYHALDPKDVERAVVMHAKENQIQTSDVYSGFHLFVIGKENAENDFTQDTGIAGWDEAVMISVLSQEEYNQNVEQDERFQKLPEGCVWVSDSADKIKDKDTFSLQGMKLEARCIPEEIKSKKGFEETFHNEFEAIEMSFRNIQIIFPDRAALEELADIGDLQLKFEYLFNVDGGKKEIDSFCNGLRDALNDADIPHVGNVENVYDEEAYFQRLYASFFFIGIFVGVMFLLATVLIIYYKQISEGYEDRENFAIMQKVGMGKKEVQRVITTQILQVFFLPLILAAVHIAFAFPIIQKVLAILGLVNTGLFIGCTAGSMLVFVVVYGIVYFLTARTYYKIVYGKRKSLLLS